MIRLTEVLLWMVIRYWLKQNTKSLLYQKNDLVIFNDKLSSKSHFSKGLFLTYSEVDKNATAEYNNRSSRFVIMTVAELFNMCEYQISLEDILRKKI